ncbi:hypothetical protein GCM10023116_13640 [Kistimonas scapharcae]|uniref:Glycosyltransferase 2-like domain-containing protein n=1 Tax=Kistimonas scapharcae TaxID=1036133 RepID=A0ABP8V175_9GAMM
MNFDGDQIIISPMLKRISIVLAVFNCEKTIARALQSIDVVFADIAESVEVIIQDGASSDKTLSIIEKIPHVINWKMFSEQDKGIYDAWNKALRHAQGEWILFFGGDDQYLLCDIKKIVSILDAHEYLDFIVCPVRVETVEGDILVSRNKNQIIKESSFHMSLPHPSTFHNRRLFEEFGGFDTSYRIAGDYEFFARVITHRKEIACIASDPLVFFSSGGVSSSPKLSLLRLKELMRIRRFYKLSGITRYDVKILLNWLLYKVFGDKLRDSLLRMIK